MLEQGQVKEQRRAVVVVVAACVEGPSFLDALEGAPGPEPVFLKGAEPDLSSEHILPLNKNQHTKS